MTEADDVCIIHRAVARGDGSGAAVERYIDRSDLPPPRSTRRGGMSYAKRHRWLLWELDHARLV